MCFSLAQVPESNLADAKIAAKIMQEDALKEYGESHEASTQLISQADPCLADDRKRHLI